MNSAQKGSPHLQFAHSPHRQRVISLVIPNTIIIERVTYDTTDPGYPSLAGHEDANESSYYGGATHYNNINILTPSTWHWSGPPNFNYAGAADRDTTLILTGVGVWAARRNFGAMLQTFGKMRIWYPATGTIGFYSNTSSPPFAGDDFSLMSYTEITPLGPGQNIEVFAPTPADPAAGEAVLTIAFFFFGIAPAALPSTIPWGTFLSLTFP